MFFILNLILIFSRKTFTWVSDMSCILIRNGLVTDSERSLKADILIKNGKIAEISPSIGDEKLEENAKIIDAGGLVVMPGVIDAHTHYHLVSRGTVTADSFVQGSRLAAFGGVTTVVDFADHNKGQGLVQSADYRLAEMKDMAIDYTIHQGVYGHGYDDTIPAQLENLKKKGIKTLKIFTTYRETGYLIEEREKLADLFRNAKRLGMLVTAHCEYNPLIEEISSNWKGTFLPKDHADLRPAEAEGKAIEFYGTAALEASCPLYIVHVSSECGLEAIRKLRAKGAEIYAETTPTYLFLDRSKLEGSDGSLYVMTPPLRTKKDNRALIEAVINGEIQVVATDHCSFTREQKLETNDVRKCYPGIPGTEEMLLLLNTLRLENQDRFSLQHLVRLVCANPAKFFGIYPEKGSFEAGTDADLIIFDPYEKRILDDSNVHSASHYTPYRGFEVSGKVKTTILRGEIIMDNDQYYGKPGNGKFLTQTDVKKVVIGNDHGGVKIAKRLKEHLENRGFIVNWVGTETEDAIDFPIPAVKACNAYLEGGYEFGIVCCGTGLGISICANKIKGIRCAVPQNCFAASMAKEHNDANFLSFGGRIDYPEDPVAMLDAFIDAKVSTDERHLKRRAMIAQFEK